MLDLIAISKNLGLSVESDALEPGLQTIQELLRQKTHEKSLEELMGLGRDLLGVIRKKLEAGVREIEPIAMVGNSELGLPDALVTADIGGFLTSASKDAFAHGIALLLEEGRFNYVLLVFDSYQLSMRNQDEVKAFKLFQKISGLGLKEIHAMTGIGTLFQAVCVIVQTPSHGSFINMAYDTDSGKAEVKEIVEQKNGGLEGGRFKFDFSSRGKKS